MNNTNELITVTHSNGNVGVLLDTYTDHQGRAILEVLTVTGRKAYWKAAKCTVETDQ